MFNFSINSSFNFDPSEVHSIHPYPAKFPPSVPHQLLQQLAKPNDVVLDPFCGSGTTLAEGLSLGCNVIGNDINYIALLISRVKTSNYDKKDFEACEKTIKKVEDNYKNKISINNPADFKGINHWFQENVRYELDLIRQCLKEIKNEKQRNLLNLTFSNIILDVSNQESDTRYVAINKNIQDGATIQLFLKKYHSIKEKLSGFQHSEIINVTILEEDARTLASIKDDIVDIIITSPPYANTYDYYLYHKQRMNWLDYDFTISKNLEIGSRNEYSSQKRPIETWLNDLKRFIGVMKRVIKKDGSICLIIGDSVVQKKIFDVHDAIKNISRELELDFVFSTSVSLSKNSKKFNHKFRSQLDKQEHAIILKK